MEKVLFVITSKKANNTGQGGHYYSLLTYISELKKLYNISILHYSEIAETVLDSHMVAEVAYEKIDDIIDLYDHDYSRYGKVIFFGMPEPEIHEVKHECLGNGITTISIKPGASNPRIYYPYFDNVMLFSIENYEWFTRRYAFRKQSGIFYLPNRIVKISKNNERLQGFTHHRSDCINIIKIAKIQEKYKDAFIKTINLHKVLQDNNIKVNTVFVGVCADKGVKEDMERHAEGLENISILTDTGHTDKARELLPLFDMVVGTGRGFIEAVTENKTVLGISNKHDIPIIVDENNYSEFKKMNFSLRNAYYRQSSEEELWKILKAIHDVSYRKQLAETMFNFFRQDYNSKGIYDFFKRTEFVNKPSRSTLIKDHILFYLLVKTRNLLQMNDSSGD